MSFVEYHDPDGLFPLISKQLHDHLPLKNLHWTSSTGIVHAIDSLYIDFVLDGQVKGAGSSSEASRRHQLPGLRQTPFLKLFLLRCDDKDAYKTFKRDALRSWLDTATIPSIRHSRSSIKQGNHDAFEWLVIHVVLPNTLAATEPRWTRDSDSEIDLLKEKFAGGTHWPRKRPRSILERLRADFNHTTKSAPDRIGQVRLKKDEVPLDVGPELPPATPSSYSETAKERDNAWLDVVAKVKLLILRSFDLRVTQYEDDLQVKEVQRSLPGWNFCTFFILKEGLARAFESIGLVVDALRAYEELLVELDQLVDKHFQGQTASEGPTTFARYTREYSDLVCKLLESTDVSKIAHPAQSALQRPLDSTRKNYRELIVANDISVFDFKCYVHSRKIELLMRLGKPRAQTSVNSEVTNGAHGADRDTKNAASSEEYEDLAILADLARFGSDSIPILARLLRDDLSHCGPESRRAVEVIVVSWTYAAARQMFMQTDSKQFHHAELAVEVAGNTLSLSPKKKSIHAAADLQVASNGLGVFTSTNLQAQRSSATLKNHSLLQAAADRAGFCVSQRRMLCKVLKWKQWRLNDSNEFDEETEDGKEAVVYGVHDYGKQLAQAVLNRLRGTLLSDETANTESLRSEYERLSSTAASLFLIAGRERSSNELQNDLAELKFHGGDFAAAASILASLLSSWNHSRWNSLETAVLRMYAASLKIMNRKDDYVRVVLSLLAKKKGLFPALSEESLVGKRPRAEFPWVDEDMMPSPEAFNDVCSYSDQLPYDIQTPLDQYFRISHLDQHIILSDDKDGFSLQITVRPCLQGALPRASVSLCLYGTGESEGSELWLRSHPQIALTSPSTQVALTSNVTSFSSYRIGKIILQAGRIAFVHEVMRKPQPHNPLLLPQSELDMSCELGKRAPIRCYPRHGALKAGLEMAKFLHMGQSRDLELSVYAGRNDVQSARVTLKSGTAGLRIHTGRSRAMEPCANLRSTNTPGALEISKLAPMEHIRVLIPTDLEHDCSHISISIEVEYETLLGMFTYVRQVQIHVQLPLDVNVQDLFRQDHIWSKFYLSSTKFGPLHIVGVSLENNKNWRSEGGIETQNSSPVLVTQSEPVCVSYRIVPRNETCVKSEWSSRMLKLRLAYRPLCDDLILAAVALLRNACQTGPFRALEELMIHTFESALRDYFSPQQLEEAALFGGVEMPSFSDIDWAPTLEALCGEDRAAVTKWLQAWHATTGSIELVDVVTSEHILEIDFEVPTLDYLHSVALMADDVNMAPSTMAREPIITTASTLHCRIVIDTTCRWAHQDRLNAGILSHFSCRLDYDPATWLISGPECIILAIGSSKSRVINLTLTALRCGYAALPAVRIEPVTNGTRDRVDTAVVAPMNDGPGAEAAILSPASSAVDVHPLVDGVSTPTHGLAQSQVTCETVCTTEGNGVLVVDSLDRVAVTIDDNNRINVQEASERTRR